jgi:hypothetical protein
MDQATHTTQVYSPFGSGYVPESHSPDQPPQKPPGRRRGIIIVLGLLAISTAAGAIAATSWKRMATVEESAPRAIFKIPGAFGLEDSVY